MHIGKEIRKIVEARGIKPLWLAKEINTSRRNIYDIFDRADVNTGMLLKISKAVGFNFLSFYEIQLPSMVQEPTETYKVLESENRLLKEQLELTEKLVESKDKLLKEYKKKQSKAGQ